MIGVVGPDRETARLANTIEEAGGSPLVGDATEVTNAATTAIVAVGESAFVDVARLGVDVPVLPVDVRPEFEGSADGVKRLYEGDYRTDDRPILEIRVDGERVDRAVFDVMLDTEDPGTISEYGVRTADSTDRFRADGVVVATPSGSRGYANAAGGPLLDPSVEAAAVVPVAAFELGADPWVVDLPITLTVERDVCPVSLLVDGREHSNVGSDCPVEVSIGGELTVVEPPPDSETR